VLLDLIGEAEATTTTKPFIPKQVEVGGGFSEILFCSAVVGHGGRAVPAAADAAGRRELTGIRRRGRHPLLRRRRQDHHRTFQTAVRPSFIS
jgi:hypothetical protein